MDKEGPTSTGKTDEQIKPTVPLPSMSFILKGLSHWFSKNSGGKSRIRRVFPVGEPHKHQWWKVGSKYPWFYMFFPLKLHFPLMTGCLNDRGRKFWASFSILSARCTAKGLKPCGQVKFCSVDFWRLIKGDLTCIAVRFWIQTSMKFWIQILLDFELI